MKNVDRIPDLRYLNRAIRATWIVRTHLPDYLRKTAQDLGAMVLLPDLRLVQREPSFCRTAGGKPARRSSESTSQIILRGAFGLSATVLNICQIWHNLLAADYSTYCSSANGRHAVLAPS